MKRIVAWLVVGPWALAAGCGDSRPPARPTRPGAETRPVTAPGASSRPVEPTTRPAETRPAAAKPTTSPAGLDFDAELAKVVALAERTEFFEAMKACRDLRMALREHPRSGELASLARRLKEYRRRAPAMAETVRGLSADSREVRRVAAASLAQAGELGRIYLRKLLRSAPTDAVATAGDLLAHAKDPNTPAILLAKLRDDAPDKLRAAMMEPLTRLIEQTPPAELRQAYGLALSASPTARLDWLDYFAAVLDRRCAGAGAKLDELLATDGAFEKLQAIARAVAKATDPVLADRARRYIGAFGLAIAQRYCLLCLQADRGVELNAAGRVVRWPDLSPHGNHALQTAETQWPRIGTVGQRKFVAFDGKNDHLVLPAGFADFSQGLTMAVWAHPSDTKNWGRFLDLGNGLKADNIVLSRNGETSGLAFQVYRGNRVGKVIAPKAIENGAWHHYVATQDPNGQVVLYRDAKPVAAENILPPNQSVVRKLNYVARSNWPGDEYYQGMMDDVRVFNCALTAGDVRMIFQRTRPKYTEK